MELTRRHTVLMGASAIALGGVPLRTFASAEDVIATFTGGADIGSGDIKLAVPEIAENGYTVPIKVSSVAATEILVVAMGNPLPNVAIFKFGKLAASRAASTRIRLAETQDVIVIAKLEDGSFVQASRTVEVTIGGCGS